MIVVRQVFQAKSHQSGAVVQAMTEGTPKIMSALSIPVGWRVLTDLSGPLDTVVLEIEAENLADWERGRADLFESQAFQQQIAASDGLIIGGRSEFYTIEAKG